MSFEMVLTSVCRIPSKTCALDNSLSQIHKNNARENCACSSTQILILQVIFFYSIRNIISIKNMYDIKFNSTFFIAIKTYVKKNQNCLISAQLCTTIRLVQSNTIIMYYTEQ